MTPSPPQTKKRLTSIRDDNYHLPDPIHGEEPSRDSKKCSCEMEDADGMGVIVDSAVHVVFVMVSMTSSSLVIMKWAIQSSITADEVRQ